MITHLSFDLDGTLIDEEYDSYLWNEEIPRIYAEQENISAERAKEKVYSEYYKALFIEKINNWTDIIYWFKKLKLSSDKLELILNDMKKNIKLFDDSISTLKKLSKKYKLIAITNNDAVFLKLKLEAENINQYFTCTFSAPSDLGVLSKNKEVYIKVLEKLKLSPKNMLHIGNDHKADYEAPISAGIKALHLVRSKYLKGEHVIHSLNEIEEKIVQINNSN